jgi:preprotein translocase subunit SecD
MLDLRMTVLLLGMMLTTLSSCRGAIDGSTNAATPTNVVTSNAAPPNVAIAPVQASPAVNRSVTMTFTVKPAATNAPITETDLKEVGRILTQRAQHLGLSNTLKLNSAAQQVTFQVQGALATESLAKRFSQKGLSEFREQKTGTSASYGKPLTESMFQPAVISGKNIMEAKAESRNTADDPLQKFDPELMKNTPISTIWSINLKFDQAGATEFTALTRRLAGTGRMIGIFLDGQLISSPTVGQEYAKTGITGGTATISNGGGLLPDEQSARELSALLASGTLSNPIELRNVQSNPK